MRIAVVTVPGVWSGSPATAAAVVQAWARRGHHVEVMAPPAVPASPPRRLAATPERAALRLAAPAAEPDPLADRLAAADLALGLIDALEFHDGGGPELARLAAAAASAAVPLVALTPCLAISTRELRTVGVEAAYAVDAAAPATVLDRIAQTWSW